MLLLHAVGREDFTGGWCERAARTQPHLLLPAHPPLLSRCGLRVHTTRLWRRGAQRPSVQATRNAASACGGGGQQRQQEGELRDSDGMSHQLQAAVQPL